MNNKENVKELYEQNKPAPSGNGLFLKLEDGQTVRLRFLDLPVVFESEYEGKASTKYAWPVYNHDEGQVQILQGGATIYNALNGLVQDEDWGDPSTYDVKVSRTGKGKETKYAVNASPKSLDLPEDLTLPNVEQIISASQFAHDVHKLGAATKPKDVVIDDIDNDIAEGKHVDLSEIPF